MQGIQCAKNSSTFNSKLREMERAQLDLVKIRKKRADIATKIANKIVSLSREQDAEVEDHHKRMLRDLQKL